MAQKITGYCEWCHLDDDHCKCSRSAARGSRFPDDDMLRVRGFKIVGRPKNGQNIWERHRQLYDELTALEIAEQESGRD